MTAVSAKVLYTPEVLALATSLADYPLGESRATLPLRADARSPTCGSSLTIGLAVNEAGAIAGIGARVQACAIGQAAAAIFLNAALGQDTRSIADSERAVAVWLSGRAGLPDWPGLSLISGAIAYPARHGAILLPWRAARSALCSAASGS